MALKPQKNLNLKKTMGNNRKKLLQKWKAILEPLNHFPSFFSDSTMSFRLIRLNLG